MQHRLGAIRHRAQLFRIDEARRVHRVGHRDHQVTAIDLRTLHERQENAVVDRRDAAHRRRLEAQVAAGRLPTEDVGDLVPEREQAQPIGGMNIRSIFAMSRLSSSSRPDRLGLVSRKNVTSIGAGTKESQSTLCRTPLSNTSKSAAFQAIHGNVAAPHRHVDRNEIRSRPEDRAPVRSALWQPGRIGGRRRRVQRVRRATSQRALSLDGLSELVEQAGKAAEITVADEAPRIRRERPSLERPRDNGVRLISAPVQKEQRRERLGCGFESPPSRPGRCDTPARQARAASL